MNSVLPLVSGAVSLAFTAFLLQRFASRKGMHHLAWSLGMLLYAAGGLCEAWYGFFGWSATVFRVWYICGAFLSAAWLGQGTLYLLARRRPWVHALAAVLVLGSLFAAVRVATALLDPSLAAAGRQMTGKVIVSPGVRTLTPIFNVYGTLALVGGAAWSAWLLLRSRGLPHRVVGSVLIAVGALLPALGGSFSRLGLDALLYASELLGALLMFAGFLLSTRPAQPRP